MRVLDTAYRVPFLFLALVLGGCTDPAAPPAADDRSSTAPAPVTQIVSDVFGAEFLESFDLYSPLGQPVGNAWQAAPVLWHPNKGSGATVALSPVIEPAFVSNTYSREPLGKWAISKHMRDEAFWRDIEGPFKAWHHPDNCNAPPLDHDVTSYDESVFLCRNHMMTAVNASGYGVTYLTPDRMVDISRGTATVRFDVATLRTTKNDWIDLWITPYDENLVTPLDELLKSVDLQGQPRRAIHIRMTANARDVSAFEAYLIYDHVAYPIRALTSAGYESVLTGVLPEDGDGQAGQSATVRERFVLELSRTHIRFGMAPRLTAAGAMLHPGLRWIDADIPDLGATRGVVQLGHHSMNPAGDGGRPTTWHWDNVGINPSVPFTIVNATSRYADAGSPSVTLRSAAPSDARLRFAAHGSRIEVSFDGGRRWTTATRQKQLRSVASRFNSYWMPIPAGATTIRFRGVAAAGFGSWFVRDVSVWAGGGTSGNDDDDDDD